MVQENIENKIVAYGRIVSIRENKNNTVLTLHSKNGRDIYPRFVVDKSISIPKDAKHQRVVVTGYTKGYKREKKGKTVTEQYFVAEKIEPDKTIVEKITGTKGIFFDAPRVEIFYSGKIQSVMDDGSWVRYAIRVDENTEHGLSVVHVSMKKIERQPDLQFGDKVAMACYLSTPKKENENGVRYYEDIIVADIAKL